MAARRLIAILIALLIVSSLAAALAPRQPAEEETTTSSEPTTQTDAPKGEAALLRERIPPAPTEPVEIDADVGDELRLAVEVARPTEVSIPGLGQTAFASPGVPARFDLLLRTPGKSAVTAGDGRAVAIITADGRSAAAND